MDLHSAMLRVDLRKHTNRGRNCPLEGLLGKVVVQGRGIGHSMEVKGYLALRCKVSEMVVIAL